MKSCRAAWLRSCRLTATFIVRFGSAWRSLTAWASPGVTFWRRSGCVAGVAAATSIGKDEATARAGATVSNVTSVSASTGIGVFVGYADSLRADIGNFPTPWSGSPNVTFRGCLPGSCEYDAGAVRIVNNSGGPVTVNDVKVHISTCTYSGWGPATLTSGSELIVTQLTTGGVATGCPANAFM